MFSKITKILVLMILLVIGFVISVFPVAVSCEPPEVEGWTLTVDRGSITGNPDLVEYVWTTNRTPYGLYDKIAVRRVVRADGEAGEGVVFLLPGTWSSGEQLVHVRKDGVQYGIPDADKSILLYLAKRGFDVYTLDYRTHFVPHTVTNLTFMLNWGWDAWMGDMKAAVNLIKTVSGVSKIYIAGESFGGGAAMNYASMYWEEDLRGIILLDAFWCKSAGKLGLETNSYNLTAAMEEIIASGEYSWPSAGGPNNPIWAYALKHPGETALIDYLMDQLYLARTANPYSYPWSQPAPMFAILASFDPYWPARLGNESIAYMDYEDCPYLPYDFDDHYIEIDVPVIAFLSERFGYYYWGEFVNGIANPDFTGILLEGYGHLDVFAGTYVREDVNEPTYQWLMGARRLTVTSSPITGIAFTVDGVPQTTPYTEWLPEGSYTLEMPETHTVGEAKYYWNQWSDGVTSRSRTVTMDTEVTLTGDFDGPYYELTVASSPITGIPFTIDELPQTTPYTEWLPEGSYTLEMPETHTVGEAKYYWNQWSDGVTSRSRTVVMDTSITLTGQFGQYNLTVTSSPITGITFTINGTSKTTPYTGWLLEGSSVSLVMPEIHVVGEERYYWHQWSDGNTSRSRTVTMNTNITLTAHYTGPCYWLTVTSSPITGIPFTIDGNPKTTPYTEWLLEGSYTLEMPETHTVGEAKYYWNQWSDGVTSRSRTIAMDTEVTLTGDFDGPYYELTVASSPITGIPFTIDELPQTTPYTEWLPEGSYKLIMPETRKGYVWSHWLEDGDTNRIKTITLQGTTWTAVYIPEPVGGKATPINIPMNKPELQTPWIWLLTILLVVAVVTVGYAKKRKRYRDYLFNKQSKNQ